MSKLDPQDVPYLVYGLGWSCMFLSITCSCYIVFRVVGRWKREGILPLTVRFPFYIAFTDLFLAFSLFLDQVHDVLYHSNWDGVMCKLTATIVGIAVFTNMTLVLCISIATYYAVVLGRSLDFGKYDWKLFLAVILFASTAAFAGLPSAGPSRYWCFDRSYAADKSLSIMALCVEFTIFTSIFIFSSMVYLRIRKLMRQSQILDNADSGITSEIHGTQSSSFAPKSKRISTVDNVGAKKNVKGNRFTKMSKKAGRKVLSYILNYFIQWTSAVPTTVGNLFDYYEDWTVILANIGMNCGGMLNLFWFIRNEGWIDTAEEE
ncbi:hypothetical protein HDV06_000672 [Boothiomyces sp. JEL0866]|nr:hypothetical protein HDV06_000672 [Boothiomyces sp. JEL0866]